MNATFLSKTMNLSLAAEPIPLTSSEDGAVRVGGTRVTLDTIVHAFNEGATVEEIAYRYPAVHLTDIYAAITYYLRHRDEVDHYVQEREAQAAVIKRRNELRHDSNGLRERLLARQRGA